MRVDLELHLRARFQPTNAKLFGADERHVAGDRLQALVHPVAQAIAKRPMLARVDPDGRRLALGDQLAESFPLFVEGAAVPSALIMFTERIAADGELLDALLCAAVVKHQDGRASRRKHGRRHEARVHRVLVVLAVDHQPHVDAGLAHQLRQQVGEAVVEHAVDCIDPLALRQNRQRPVGHDSLIPRCGVFRLSERARGQERHGARDQHSAQYDLHDFDSQRLDFGRVAHRILASLWWVRVGTASI